MKAITNARLIDGTGYPPIENATVVVNNNGIEAVGTGDSVEVSPDAEKIDASGMTLLPGLIDCYDHLANFSYELAPVGPYRT